MVEEIRDILEAFNKNVDNSSDDESEELIGNDGEADNDRLSSKSENSEWYDDNQEGMDVENRHKLEGSGSAVNVD